MEQSAESNQHIRTIKSPVMLFFVPEFSMDSDALDSDYSLVVSKDKDNQWLQL